MNVQDELNEFIEKLGAFSIQHAPSWLKSNSYHVGILPGHNLDLLQIAFDFKVDRIYLLLSDTPDVLKDPSKGDLSLVK